MRILLFILLLPLASLSQVTINSTGTPITINRLGFPASVYINSGETPTTPPLIVATYPLSDFGAMTIAMEDVPPNALLVLTTADEDENQDCVITSTPALSWVKWSDGTSATSSNAEIWTAVYPAGGEISFTANWGFNYQSVVCYVVTGAEPTLYGASATGVNESLPDVNVNTTRTQSIIFCVTSDNGYTSGTTREYRNELEAYPEDYWDISVGDATFYHYHYNATTTGTYAVGMVAPNMSSKANTAVFEVRGANVQQDAVSIYSGYTLQFSTGYEVAGDVTTSQGQYNTKSNTIKASGDSSFKSVIISGQPPLFGGYRSEMQYSEGANGMPEVNLTEGIWEYDAYYENWTNVYQDAGHSIQWHPLAGGSAIVSLQNYVQNEIYLVHYVGGGGDLYATPEFTITPNTWTNFRWKMKFSTGTDGYIQLYVNNKIVYNYTGITADPDGPPYWKVGQNRFEENADGINDATTVYYDNVKVYQK